MIIDFHAHVERDLITKKYDIESIIQDMDANGIGVRMISTLKGKSIRDQNDAMISYVRQYPERLMACAVINFLPPFIFYVFMQSKFKEGMTLSGIKG